MKIDPFFTTFKPIKVGDKLTIKPEFMDPGDENYTFYSIEDQLEGMGEIRMRATRNADGSRAIGIQSIRFEMLVMEPRETKKPKTLLALEDVLKNPDLEIRAIIGAAGFKDREITVEKARAVFGPNQYHATIYVPAVEVPTGDYDSAGYPAFRFRVSDGDKTRVAAAEKALFDTFGEGSETEYFRDGNIGRFQLYIDADAFVSNS